AAISYCFVREKQAVGVFFIVDVSRAASMDAANSLVHKADRYATALIDTFEVEALGYVLEYPKARMT
ncbi:hypothetical protein CTI14_53440, partial [Methylobacterium radiotolerans]